MSKIRVIVGMGSCGLAAGAENIYNEFRMLKHKYDFILSKTGCIGMCYSEVLVEVIDDSGSTMYGNVNVNDVEDILKSHVMEKKSMDRLVILKNNTGKESSFLKKQVRIVLRNVGHIDPLNIDDYIANRGYEALKRVLNNMSGDDVINFIEKSGLRGRGGAGFPTGKKWRFAKEVKGNRKYVICNADEGDPGAFMDRSILEGDPHSVIEGMIIAAYAIGANKGIIYVRAEYPFAIKHLKKAINDAKMNSFLGDNILNSNFSFSIDIKEGAGAFVCGEETALIASIEGKRGMPRIRPPFPAQSGVWGYPTNINNVETYANVPWIILNGYKKFSNIGTSSSKGTKVFALAGKVKKGGLIEVPMGIIIREVVYDIAGGAKAGHKIKAVQLGGPSGGCIPENLFDTPIDYDSLVSTGAIMGSGGMVVIDETSCMVDIAKFFLSFTQKESCGKCTFCRVGIKRMLEILERITNGNGSNGDIEKLIELAENIKSNSLCGLGQTAPNPVLTTIRYFRDEYEAHIYKKTCPAGVCRALITYYITHECVGCNACTKVCPVNAISGKIRERHVINPDICIKCGRCESVCKFKAIKRR